MFKKCFLGFFLCTLLITQVTVYAQSKAKKHTSISKSKKRSSKGVKKGVNSATSGKKSFKKGSKLRSSKKGNSSKRYIASAKEDSIRNNTLQIIASNKEKERITDSIHRSYVLLQNISNNTTVDQGYFATMFTEQKRSASFQNLEGTASVFKSISGWQDKKFYILTNEIPVGTIVKVTTADLKIIFAKVINALPEVSNSIQYRLSDAAAAILGVNKNNKTFPISVTY
jgi:hypothetical protein